MIPYVQLDGIAVGPVVLHPFGILILLGVVAMHTVLVRRARDLAPPAVVEGFALALGAGGLGTALVAGSRAGSLSFTFAAAGALLAGSVYLVARGLDALRFADAAAAAFPYGWILARLGCALAHDHLGPASTSALAVAFPTGPRLDLGFLEWLLTPLLFAAANLGARRGRPGAVAGAVALTYAGIRFPLDMLREGDPRFAGLTLAQWGTIPLLVAGIALLVGLDQGQPVTRKQR